MYHERKADLEEEFPLAHPAEIDAMIARESLLYEIGEIDTMWDVRYILERIINLIPDIKEKFDGR